MQKTLELEATSKITSVVLRAPLFFKQENLVKVGTDHPLPNPNALGEMMGSKGELPWSMR